MKRNVNTTNKKGKARKVGLVLVSVLLICVGICYARIRPVLLSRSLVHAIKQDSLKDAKRAVDRGADPNALICTASGWDGAFWEESNVDLLEALLGKQLHHVNRMTPLLLATSEGKDDIAQFLVAHGADVNFHDQADTTPLLSAAYFCNATTMRLLIKKGADVNARWKDGTPVIANATGRPQILAILERAGAKE